MIWQAHPNVSREIADLEPRVLGRHDVAHFICGAEVPAEGPSKHRHNDHQSQLWYLQRRRNKIEANAKTREGSRKADRNDKIKEADASGSEKGASFVSEKKTGWRIEAFKLSSSGVKCSNAEGRSADEKAARRREGKTRKHT